MSILDWLFGNDSGKDQDYGSNDWSSGKIGDDGRHDIYFGQKDGTNRHGHAVYGTEADDYRLMYFRADDGTVIYDESRGRYTPEP